MIRNLRELYQYRALLWALSARELKARYRASVMGFLWTFLNPTLNMLVYWVAFGVIMRGADEKDFNKLPFMLFCGLLPWTYFVGSVLGGTTSVSDRKDLLTKVRFPAQVLPATVVLTNLLNFLFSVPLLFLLGAIYQDWPTWHLVYAIPLLAVQTVFTLAVTYLLSALNVAFRDLQHIVGNVLQMLFFLTPVLWSVDQFDGNTFRRMGFDVTAEQARMGVIYGNPMAAIINAWRDIFYRHQIPDWQPLLLVFVFSVVVLAIASVVFERRREEFAELV